MKNIGNSCIRSLNSYNFLSFTKSECTALHFSAIIKMFPPVRLQSNDQSACHLWQCRQGIGLATHFQMSKMRMRKQTQKRVSAGFVNVEVGLDAPWSVQPHRWKRFIKRRSRLFVWLLTSDCSLTISCFLFCVISIQIFLEYLKHIIQAICIKTL